LYFVYQVTSAYRDKESCQCLCAFSCTTSVFRIVGILQCWEISGLSEFCSVRIIPGLFRRIVQDCPDFAIVPLFQDVRYGVQVVRLFKLSEFCSVQGIPGLIVNFAVLGYFQNCQNLQYSELFRDYQSTVFRIIQRLFRIIRVLQSTVLSYSRYSEIVKI
jgi:hypothetical protein